METPFPTNEPARIRALQRYHILDTAPQTTYDDLARLAAHICGTPIVLISLVDTDRLWFKARVGVEVAEIPRKRTCCAHTILHADILVVPDTMADERFRDDPSAGLGAPIRFYAGVPLMTHDGYAIGTLSVQDYVPREISPEQAAALAALGRQVMEQIELRQQIAGLEQTVAQRERIEAELAYERDLLHTLMDNIPDHIYFKDAKGRFTRNNRAQIQMLGFQDPGQALGKTLLDVFPSAFAQEIYADDLWIIQTGQPVIDAIQRLEMPGGESRWHSTTKVPIKDKDGQVIGIVGISRNITERVQAEEQIRQLNAQLEERIAMRTAQLEAANHELEEEMVLRGRLTEELRQQHEYLAALHETGLGLMNRLELNDLLGAMVVRAAALLGTPNGYIYMLDETSGELVKQVGIGHSADKQTGLRVVRGEGIAGRVWATGQPIVIDNYDAWEGRMGDIPRGRYHSVVGVPLRSGQQVVGVLGLAYNEPGHTFSENQVALLVRLAHLASIALDNARLYTAVQQELAERRRIEATLRESEARLRLVMAQMPAVLWTTDRDLRLTSSTGAALNGLVANPDRGPGQSLLEALHTDDADFPPIAMHRRALAGESVSFELNWRGRIFQAHVEPFQDLQGQIIGCIGVGLDITETKQAAEMLTRLDSQRKRLFEISQSILSTLEFDDVVQQILHALQGLLDYNACVLFWHDVEAGLLRPMMLGWDADTSDELRQAWTFPFGEGISSSVIRTGQGVLANNAHSDPRSIWTQNKAVQAVFPSTKLHAIVVPVKTKERVIGVFSMLRANDPPFTEDEFELVQLFSNHASLAIENALLFEHIMRSEQELREARNELKQRVDERTAELRAANERLRQELHERKRAEAELQQERALLALRVEERTADLSTANAELARASRLKDEFLASMSHELRTPLNGILAVSEALQEQIYGPLTDSQCRSITIIEESGRHLLALINDILDLSKIGAGKLDLEIALVAVEPIARASLRLIEESAHKKQLKVVTSFDSAVGEIMADARRLTQILVNLLNNAVKFTPQGGTIGLEVAGDSAEQLVRLTVWDSGIGIAPEDQERLFQPFTQLDSSLARQYDGTGLGLALVHGMVKLHGGNVTVESEIGQGSSFTVALPWQVPGIPGLYDPPATVKTRARPAPPPDAAEPETMLAPDAPLVLLAEDNELNIITLSDYLEIKGYRVAVARNGHEAIAQTRELRPALILMDSQMPGLDGLEAIRRIRADADLAGIHIIALTAMTMPGDRERCLAAGANDYLSKPVSLKSLVAAIDARLRPDSS